MSKYRYREAVGLKEKVLNQYFVIIHVLYFLSVSRSCSPYKNPALKALAEKQ